MIHRAHEVFEDFEKSMPQKMGVEKLLASKTIKVGGNRAAFVLDGYGVGADALQPRAVGHHSQLLGQLAWMRIASGNAGKRAGTANSLQKLILNCMHAAPGLAAIFVSELYGHLRHRDVQRRGWSIWRHYPGQGGV